MVTKKDEPRIVEGSATMIGVGAREANPAAADELERRIVNARKKALDRGLSEEERSDLVRRAVDRFRAGEPEEA